MDIAEYLEFADEIGMTVASKPAGFYECCEHCDDEAPCREGYYPDRPDTHMTECEHCETSTGPTLAYLNPRD